jgi:integrase/recombinase XerD
LLVADALEEFLADHRGRGSRPATLDWYAKTVRRLLKTWMDQDTEALTVFVVNRALSREVKPSSLANYDRALRGFCNWLHGVGLLKSNPFTGRKRPRTDWQPKQVLTPAEITAMFRVAGQDGRSRHRFRAILALFLETGLRASELARLRLEDVDWNAGVLRVDGKTGRGTTPVGRRTLKLLRSYVTQERKGLDQHLFLYRRQPLNQAALSHLVNRLARQAGIKRPVGTHLLRHTFATTYLRNGGDAFSLQRLMRHTTPFMTSRYVHFAVSTDLAEKQARFSPMAGLRLDD